MATCIFTSMNVPYGVLSSVMTNKQNERALLSISRASLGALGVFVISSYAPDLVENLAVDLRLAEDIPVSRYCFYRAVPDHIFWL